MAHVLTAADERKLIGLHPLLVQVVRTLAEDSPIPFMVIEGLRTAKRQKALVEAGASWTLDSRHLTGHAVDLAPIAGGKPSWAWPLYYQFAPHVKSAAKKNHAVIEWGGDWWRKKDGPHWELSRRIYPAQSF